MKQCGKALLKALDEFIVINGHKTGVKEIHLVNYNHEVNNALVEVFDEVSGKQISDGNENSKRKDNVTSDRRRRNGNFRRHHTRGRGSHRIVNSFCENSRYKRVEREEFGTTFVDSETYEKYSANTWEIEAGIHGDFIKTRDVDQDEIKDDSNESDNADTLMVNNTKQFEGNLTIIDG